MLDLLNRVEAGDEVTITRHGRPVAVVVRPDGLRARRAGGAMTEAARVRELLVTARGSAIPKDGGLSPSRADELVDDVRRGRSR